MGRVVKLGRNDACSCGSGKKFKKCCEEKQARSRSTMVMAVLVGVLVIGGIVSFALNFSADATHTARKTGVWSAEHGHYH